MIINGVINLNKKKGISSFKAVREVRRAVGVEKAGHTGTLDPEASGVLPVCLGKSTRLADYLVNTKKEYFVQMFLGIETETCDLEGDIISYSDNPHPEFSVIESVIKSFIGEIEQVPPIYSAIKVNGRKLYEYARKGEYVEIKPRDVVIYYIEDIEIGETAYSGYDLIQVSFKVGCSKGTYIRSLCRDIGSRLGTKGVMSGLIRTKSGKFTIEESYSIEQIIDYFESGRISELLIPPGKLLDLEVIFLDNIQYEDYMSGRKVVLTGSDSGEYLVKDKQGVTIGIGSVDENGRLKSRKRL